LTELHESIPLANPNNSGGYALPQYTVTSEVTFINGGVVS
jgi:hypothetical protein